MYAISLSSIPPRFDWLAPVLARLLAQDPAPQQVLLSLPRSYRRFPGHVSPPTLPEGVTLLWSDVDYGPATKVLPAARALAGQCTHLIYCDDDWLVPPHWAKALLNVYAPNCAVTGQGFDIERLGRTSNKTGDHTDIAQGFSGVLIDPAWLAGDDLDPPDVAWPVDDIWLSGHLARQGMPIRMAPTARVGMKPAHQDSHGLQDISLRGLDRNAANRACAAFLHEKYGIWPARGA